MMREGTWDGRFPFEELLWFRRGQVTPQREATDPAAWQSVPDSLILREIAITRCKMDDQTRLELEAAAFRRLVSHLREHTEVQNIDLMNLAGFCRNCLSNWMKEAADQKGIPLSKDQSREAVYGMPYEEWRAKYQKEASPEQKAAFEKSHRH
jgi:hypothetical protein